jgi:hypothetical protein
LRTIIHAKQRIVQAAANQIDNFSRKLRYIQFGKLRTIWPSRIQKFRSEIENRELKLADIEPGRQLGVRSQFFDLQVLSNLVKSVELDPMPNEYM